MLGGHDPHKLLLHLKRTMSFKGKIPIVCKKLYIRVIVVFKSAEPALYIFQYFRALYRFVGKRVTLLRGLGSEPSQYIALYRITSHKSHTTARTLLRAQRT